MGYQLKLSAHHCLVQDKETVNFHVKSDDYFGTLATIISLIGQKPNLKTTDYKKIINSLHSDLKYLQDNYKIIKK